MVIVRGNSIEILLYLASKASETVSGLNNENQRYMLLANERSEYQCILNEE